MLQVLIEELLDVRLALFNQLRQIENTKSSKLHNQLTVFKARDVYQRTLIQPLPLDDHLQNMHQIHRGLQVSFVG